MEYTKNYKLPQWVETDRILMEDFNQAMADIDAGLEAVTTDVADGQEQLGTELLALAAALGSGGHTARVAFGSYTGSRKYGFDQTLEFDFTPVLVIVKEQEDASHPTAMLRNCSGTYAASGNMLQLSWGDNSVTWNSSLSEHDQLNDTGTYCYVALGFSE